MWNQCGAGEESVAPPAQQSIEDDFDEWLSKVAAPAELEVPR